MRVLLSLLVAVLVMVAPAAAKEVGKTVPDADSVGSATATRKSGGKCRSGYKPVLVHVKKSDSYSVGCAKKV